MPDLEDTVDAPAAGGDDDLFGDDSNDDVGSPLEERDHILSDAELGPSDDDLDNEKLPENDESAYDSRARAAGYSDDEDDMDNDEGHRLQQQKERLQLVMEMKLYRHRLPKSKGQTLRLLRVPDFLRFIPEEYKSDSFEPTEADVSNARNNYPQETVRWMQDPDTLESRSNAALYRWSDGSVTLGVGGEQYDLQQKGLAPPADKPYNETNDAHMYAATAEFKSDVLVVFGHLTEQYTVLPTGSEKDDALSKLAARMAKAAQGRQTDMVVKVTGSDNPELLRKQVEAADRELQRAQRRREMAEMRMATGMGRPGRGTGLSAGGLETGRLSGVAGRKRGAPGGGRQRRRKPEYDSDDDLPSGVRRQDEYERDDGFIVSSGDEEEEVADQDEEEDEEDEVFLDDEDEAPRSKRQKTSTPDEGDSHEEDGGEEGGGRGRGARDAARSRRRRVVEDDDEEEDE